MCRLCPAPALLCWLACLQNVGYDSVGMDMPASSPVPVASLHSAKALVELQVLQLLTEHMECLVVGQEGCFDLHDIS